VKVQLLTSKDCAGCQTVEKMLNDMQIKYELIDVTENPDYLEKYPIYMAPAIVINNQLEFTQIPKKEELFQKIESLESNDRNETREGQSKF